MIYFIPESIELHKLTEDVSSETQDVRLDTEMDFGTHQRSKGDSTIETLDVVTVMTGEQFKFFMQWFDIVKNKTFYSTYPDIEESRIEKGKFYSFTFADTKLQISKRGRYKKEVSFKLRWNIRVPAMERI